MNRLLPNTLSIRLAHLLFLGLLCATGSKTQAQQLTGVPYPVSYDIQRMGWPSQIVSLPGGRFFYVEFWQQGPGKALAGYYLQNVKPERDEKGEEFVEAWSVLTHTPQEPPIDIRHLHASQRSVAVMGRITPKGSAEATVVQYFDMSGAPIEKQQHLSPYRKRLGNYEDFYYTSEDKTKLFWLGYNPDEPAKKRTYWGAVFNEDGKKVWSGEMDPPAVDGQRIVADAAVDNQGNIYLALVDEAPTGSASDVNTKPQLVRYDYKNKTWKTRALEVDGTTCVDLHLVPMPYDHLGVVSFMMEGDKGLPNRTNSSGKALRWSHVNWNRIHLRTQDLDIKGAGKFPVPDTLAKAYQNEKLGARFGQMQTLLDGDNVYLLAEQQWSDLRSGGRQFFRRNVFTMGINTAADTLHWMNHVHKQQTAYSDALIGYVPAITPGFLHLAFLSDIGASGIVTLASVNRNTGEYLRKEVAPNDRGNLIFFPRRSIQTEPNRLLMLGMGDPKRNEYWLLQIRGFQQ